MKLSNCLSMTCLCVCALALSASAAPDPVGPVPTDVETFTRYTLGSNLVYVGAAPTGDDKGRIDELYVRLDPEGAAIDPQTLPLGDIVALAAQHYALHSHDFSFTIGDLKAAGFLPFTIQAWRDNGAMYVSNSAAQPLVLAHWDVTPYTASSAWLLRQRSMLSDLFYLRAAGGASSGLASQPQFDQAEVPLLNPAFWANPFTGAVARIGAEPGEQHFIDYTLERGQTGRAYPEWLHRVPVFNLYKLEQ